MKIIFDFTKNASVELIFYLFNIFILPFILSGILSCSLSYCLLFSLSISPLLMFLSGKLRNLNIPFTYIFIFLCLILLHGILSFYFFDYEDNPNLFKFLLSILYSILLIMLCVLNYSIFNRTHIKKFEKAFNIFAYILLAIGCISALGFPLSNLQGKAVFYYSEPSHFVLVLIPFIIYKFMTSKKFEIYFFSAIAFKLSLAFPSAILLAILLIIPLILYDFRSMFSIYVIYTMILAITYAQNNMAGIDFNYFIDRVPLIKNNNTNLSVMVYLSGWGRAFLNIIHTYGFGIGFQQLGYIGENDFFMLSLMKDNGKLGFNDGGCLAAKFISEFGLFAVILLVLYIKKCFNLVQKLKHLRLEAEGKNSINLLFFMNIFYLSFFVPLFLRSTGYFSPILFIFMFSLLHKIYLKINLYEI